MSVLIPCWNGRHLLEQNLPSVLAAVKRLEGPSEILVVDDGSTDCVEEWLQRAMPQVRVIRRAKNQGFNAAIQTGLEAARFDLVYFLNSDAWLEPDALQVLPPHFADEQVFAVASLDVERGAPGTCVVPVSTNRGGLLGVRYLSIPEPPGPIDVLFASAGHAAYDVRKFHSVGGFDRLFEPAYWEDIDLCFRAHARGWRTVLEPKSRVHHHVGGSTSRRYSVSWFVHRRASHRWLFTLRHTPAIRISTVLALFGAYGLMAFNALVMGAQRARLIHRCAQATAPILRRFSVAAVKRAHQIPWTVAYVSATGDVVGGGEISLLTLLGALDRHRVRPILLCPFEGGFSRRARAAGIDVGIVPFPSTARALCDGALFRLVRWLREKDVDLVHVNSAGRSLFLSALAARVWGPPVVWHVRVASREWLADRVSVALTDRLLVTSQFVASRFQGKAMAKKLVRIPNPVDLAQFRAARDSMSWRARYGIKPEAVIVGVVGRFDAWKRFDLALSAFAHARTQASSLHLVMVGEGPERSRLEQLAQTLGLSPAVSFVGWQADPSEAMAAMEIILHPSREHFGRVFIEAMASGKALIAAQDGAAPELLEHEQTALLVPPGQVSGFAQALIRLARDPELRQRLGEAARERAERLYAADRVAEQVMHVYDELLDGT